MMGGACASHIQCLPELGGIVWAHDALEGLRHLLVLLLALLLPGLIQPLEELDGLGERLLLARRLVADVVAPRTEGVVHQYVVLVQLHKNVCK